LVKGQLVTPVYRILATDLRNVESVSKLLTEHLESFQFPTIVISECVLVYLEAAQSFPLLVWFAQNMRPCHFVVYEQIHPDDAFGKVMMESLENRGMALKSVRSYPTLESQEA